MSKFIKYTIALMALFPVFCANAQNTEKNYDVFIPIAKYIRMGDAESLSAWFDEDLEVSVFSTTNDASRNQAKQIIKSFFDTHKPRNFEINHTAGEGSMKFAIGSLNAGGENFGVTIFVNCKDRNYHIQQLKIEKVE